MDLCAFGIVQVLSDQELRSLASQNGATVRFGVLVNGMTIVGARWNASTNYLDELDADNGTCGGLCAGLRVFTNVLSCALVSHRCNVITHVSYPAATPLEA